MLQYPAQDKLILTEDCHYNHFIFQTILCLTEASVNELLVYLNATILMLGDSSCSFRLM